jgi:hypothetical protein
VIGRLSGGERFIANTAPDPALLADMQVADYLGRAGRVTNDGERNSFMPL